MYLRNLFREGAFFRTSGPLTNSIVEEITGKRSRPWRGILTQSLLLLLAIGVARAADPPPLRLTLRDAVQLALKQNPQVQIANLNIAVSQENQNVARSGLLPQVNLNGSESVRRSNLEALFGQAYSRTSRTHRAVLGDSGGTYRLGAHFRFNSLETLASI